MQYPEMSSNDRGYAITAEVETLHAQTDLSTQRVWTTNIRTRMEEFQSAGYLKGGSRLLLSFFPQFENAGRTCIEYDHHDYATPPENELHASIMINYLAEFIFLPV